MNHFFRFRQVLDRLRALDHDLYGLIVPQDDVYKDSHWVLSASDHFVDFVAVILFERVHISSFNVFIHPCLGRLPDQLIDLVILGKCLRKSLLYDPLVGTRVGYELVEGFKAVERGAIAGFVLQQGDNECPEEYFDDASVLLG